MLVLNARDWSDYYGADAHARTTLIKLTRLAPLPSAASSFLQFAEKWRDPQLILCVPLLYAHVLYDIVYSCACVSLLYSVRLSFTGSTHTSRVPVRVLPGPLNMFC